MTTATPTKLCQVCGAECVRRRTEGYQQFAGRRFCSAACAATGHHRLPDAEEAAFVAAVLAAGECQATARRMGIDRNTAQSICRRHKVRLGSDAKRAATARKIREMITRLPILNNTEIARRVGCNRQLVREVRRELGVDGARPRRRPAPRPDLGIELAAAPSPAQQRAYRSATLAERLLFTPEIRAWMEYAA